MQIEEDKNYEFLDEYKIIKTLGSGYHAIVKLAVDQNKTQVAIKQYKTNTASLDVLKHELKIMRQLDHQNIVRLISVRENAIYKRKDETTYQCFAIILEYVGGGQLFDFISDTGKFSEKVTRTYFHQMMNGLHFMHMKGYAHRDIKPENILIASNFVLKLADFGFSCLLKGKDGTGILKTKLGTEGYMAPEIPSRNYEGQKVDIFAAGVILFIMYAGNPPFQRAMISDPYYKIVKEQRFDIFWKAHQRKRPKEYFSKQFKNLFEKMVAFDPKDRIGIEQIANHPWTKSKNCSHEEIMSEFTERQKKLNQKLEIRRKHQQQQKKERTEGIQNQGNKSRGSENEQVKKFVNLYNSQLSLKRTLPCIDQNYKQDITLNEKEINFTVATLKIFLQKHQVTIQEDEGESLIIQSSKLKLQTFEQNKEEITATYSHSFEIDDHTFSESMKLGIIIGLNKNNKPVIHFQLKDGSYFNFKKVTRDIKNHCFA